MLMFAARYSYFLQTAGGEERWEELDDLDYGSIYGDSSFFDFNEEEDSGYSQWLQEKQEERERKEQETEQREQGDGRRNPEKASSRRHRKAQRRRKSDSQPRFGSATSES